MGLGPPSTLVRSFLGSPFYSPHQRTAPAAAGRGTWTRGLSRGIQRPKAATDQSVCCWLRSGPVRLFPLAVARALASSSSSSRFCINSRASERRETPWPLFTSRRREAVVAAFTCISSPFCFFSSPPPRGFTIVRSVRSRGSSTRDGTRCKAAEGSVLLLADGYETL